MAQFGVKYEPLKVIVQENRRDRSKVVAFLGKQLCFFEKQSLVPSPGNEVEVMITRTQCGKYPEGHDWAGHTNWSDVRALLLDVVDRSKHMLVAINGFECSGSMCRTTAHGIESDGLREYVSEDVWPNRPRGYRGPKPVTMWLTPGRCGIFEADNVNVEFYGLNRIPLRPTNVWVERSIYEEKRGCGVRVAGLTRPQDAMWWEHVKARVEA